MNSLLTALVVAALARVLLGLVALSNGATPYQFVQMAIAVEFAAVGVFLWLTRLADERARVFGAVLILCASPWPRNVLDSATGPIAAAAQLAGAVRPDSFLPVAVWRFARHYPSPLQTPSLATRLGALLAFATSTALGVGTMVWGFEPALFWPPIMAMSSAGLLALASRFRRRSPNDDRRGQILALGFTAAALPIAIHTLLDAFVPQFRRATDPGTPAFAVSAITVVGGLALSPLVTAYAVLVHQALTLRLVLKAATRRWIGRTALAATWLVPLGLTVAVALWLRGDNVSSLFGGWRLGALTVVAVTWSAATWARRGLETNLGLDLRLHTLEHSQQLLAIAKAAQQAVDADQLDEIVSNQIAGLLEVEHATLIVCSRDGVLVAPSGALRPLRSAAVDRILDAHADAFDLGDARVAASLSAADVAWLVDGNVLGLLPLRSETSDGLLGAIAIGPRSNGAPFSVVQETLGRAAAQVIEAAAHRIGKRQPESPHVEPSDAGAACVRCGSVMDAGASSCACGGELEPSPPSIVARQYRLIRRLGRGSYGVAYEALDLELERTVVIKASAAVDLATAARIRREARHMAQLRHPAVATVFGLEFWNGRPLLVMEFLTKGTLASRAAALTASDWEAMAVTLAEGLGHAHECGIAHGDIASRNVGFDEVGQAKLLDFGLAAVNPAPEVFAQDRRALLSVLRDCCPATLSRRQIEEAMNAVVRILATRGSLTADSHL
ncbi:MAG: protein kinase [Acidobacteria bacterium]|nr:protein kinase [Acidobacteriota bacterium]